MTAPAAHSVRCGDHGAAGDPEEEWEVAGFPGPEAAAEYALAEGLDHAAWVAFCIANPAMRRQDTDYDALEPGAGAGRA